MQIKIPKKSGSKKRVLNIVLPMGLSFYTFKALSYCFDLQREVISPARSLSDFACYLTAFPQLAAGPIAAAARGDHLRSPAFFLGAVPGGERQPGPALLRGHVRRGSPLRRHPIAGRQPLHARPPARAGRLRGEAFGVRCRVSGKHRFGTPTAAVAPTTTESAASLNPCGALMILSAFRIPRFNFSCFMGGVSHTLRLLRLRPKRSRRMAMPSVSAGISMAMVTRSRTWPTAMPSCKNGLSTGPHTLKVVASGTANPYAKDSFIYVDAVQFSKQNAACNFPSGGGPRQAQRMVFGRSHRTDYRDQQGHDWPPGLEVVSRVGAHQDTVAQCRWTNAAAEPISGTPDPELYRYGFHASDFWVNLTAAPGKYHARLKFAATHGLDTPTHSFDISIRPLSRRSSLNRPRSDGVRPELGSTR